MPERVGRASYASVSPRESSRMGGVDHRQTSQRPIVRAFGANAKLRRLTLELSGCEAVRLNDGLDARRVKEPRPWPTSAQGVECTPRLRDGGRRRASARMEENSPTTDTEREQRAVRKSANIQAKYSSATNVGLERLAFGQSARRQG